ncbi:MAG: two-component system chemotaxis sensor kinase CheA [Polyangiales bacterium]|jgi:two-component system chemotaxis sensor kinase CheA
MDEETQEILRDFTGESREALENIEPLLIELESDPSKQVNSETVDAAFRFFHSVKGTASFLELAHLVCLTHVAESLLDLIRRGTTPLLPTHVDLLCETLDLIRTMLDTIDRTLSDEAHGVAAERLVARLEVLVAEAKCYGATDEEEEGSGQQEATSGPTEASPPADISLPTDELALLLASMSSPEMLEKFRAETEEHIEAAEDALVKIDPSDVQPALVESAFRSVHSIKGNASLFAFDALGQAAHKLETTLDDARSGVLVLSKEAVNALLNGLDGLRVELAVICAPPHSASGDAVDGSPVQDAPPPADGSAPARTSTAKRGASIRVDTNKLDDLMNLIGELIIAETAVTHNPDLEGHHFENFQKAATQLNRLTRRLQQVTMSVRMVPVAPTFRKMLRLVRDVSGKQHKLVELVVEGEQTEVDKSVIEMISDPLVHMIRNAVDHGIEPPAEREAAGKSEQGQIRLSAAHVGQEVWITITDDGRGLNREKIFSKAVERGLAEQDAVLSDAEVYRMIFAPGFSTADEVTDVSGRGVGMDVALRNIEAMNGRVDIQSPASGGSTFVLRIPLTLAIIEGMLVRIGDTSYTLPLLSIREHVRARPEDLTTLHDGTELFRLRDTLYPIYHLHELGGTSEPTRVEDGILILANEGGNTVCLLVDEVVGQRQTVIKPVPDYLRGAKGISGCSILSNGEVCLILDVEGLIRRAALAA